jgi:hypothetical protein
MLERLVHRRYHRPPLSCEHDQRGLVQHQQARVESSPDTTAVESSLDVQQRWSRGGHTETRVAGPRRQHVEVFRLRFVICMSPRTTSRRQPEDQSWTTFM